MAAAIYFHGRESTLWVQESAEDVANRVVHESERPLPLTAVDGQRVFVNWASIAYVEERRSHMSAQPA